VSLWAALPVLFLLAAACGGHYRKLGEWCSAENTGTQGDCVDGLFCNVMDTCSPYRPSACNGTCLKRCQTDADCPAPMKCSHYVSPENGGGYACE
jgi:hypothetical protein